MVALVLVVAIGLMHAWIMVLEMVLWETARARRSFGISAEHARTTRVIAGNMGLYNGFLAAGLIWALYMDLDGPGRPIAGFFAACVFVAGLYGGATVSPRILLIQSVPAAICLFALYFGW